MLLKSRIERILGDAKEGHVYYNASVTLNALWSYSKGYTDLTNFEETRPYVLKWGYIIDAPDMPVAEFTSLVNARLVKDRIPFVVNIYMESRPKLGGLIDGYLSMGYAIVVRSTKLIENGDELVQALFV